MEQNKKEMNDIQKIIYFECQNILNDFSQFESNIGAIKEKPYIKGLTKQGIKQDNGYLEVPMLDTKIVIRENNKLMKKVSESYIRIMGHLDNYEVSNK